MLERSACVFAAGFALCWAATASGQSFVAVETVPQAIADLPEFVRVPLHPVPATDPSQQKTGQVYRIDWAALTGELPAAGQMREVPLPLPSGRIERFRVMDAPIMEAALAERFPEFRTFQVVGIDNPTAVGRLDVTSQGLRGMIRTGTGTIFIDPYSGGQRDYVSVYDLHRFVGHADPAGWACGVAAMHGAAGVGHDGPPGEEPEADPVEHPAGGGFPVGVPIRTYRIAMACTGEYGAYQSAVQGNAPNQADALAAIVTIVNRCNATFEVDLGVRFLLVANNHRLAYFDPATDPYPNADANCTSDPAADCSGAYLNINTGILNNRIGSGNYDVGHVLTRVRGGVAYLRSVCGGNKGGGVSGIPRGGEVEPVSALVPMHELGHQFGANHTFNGVLGRCNSNINGSTNWEPGGGSTLMAYPGACPVGGPIGSGETDNLVLFADPYFHTGSLTEMRAFLGGSSSSCSQNVATSNPAPTITDISPSGAIPPSTPFELGVNVFDAPSGPGAPALTYCWEQLDLGPAQRLTGPTSADNGASALFRSFPPSASAVRTFPRMSDVLAGTTSIGERLPTFTNVVRKFRVSVRDNQGASVASSRVDLIIAESDPFTVTAPAPAQVVHGPAFEVRWSRGSTHLSPISTPTVSILLSTDGGVTFPSVLASGVPNTGQAMVNAGAASPTARIRISGEGNVFFNVSGVFDLRGPCPADFNADGNLDPDDLGDYITCYFATPACTAVDFNADGSTNPDDLGDFITVFFGGCP